MKSTISKYNCRYASEHYDFCFSEKSLAQQDIERIAKTQENCFERITADLGVIPDFKIQYLLADTPQDLGVLYGDNEPCNGFARLPDKVYAVYNEEIKCIGMHEDAHIISYFIKKPLSAFLCEGLAMYFDEQWQGRPNVEWVKEYIRNGRVYNIMRLIDNSAFYDLDESISYPLAGAFTKFLIEKLTMPCYLRQIYYNDDPVSALKNIFGEKEFLESICNIE